MEIRITKRVKLKWLFDANQFVFDKNVHFFYNLICITHGLLISYSLQQMCPQSKINDDDGGKGTNKQGTVFVLTYLNTII